MEEIEKGIKNEKPDTRRDRRGNEKWTPFFNILFVVFYSFFIFFYISLLRLFVK
jgi:hypothetical protein